MGPLFITYSATNKTAEGIARRPSRAVLTLPVRGAPPSGGSRENFFEKVGVSSNSLGESRPQGKGAAKDPDQNA